MVILGVGRYNMCVSLRYPIVLHKSKEGYAVSCPALPGSWSKGTSEEEAAENIRHAIREYLAAIKETLPAADVREVEVEVTV
jgi:predicted RNase H-like HicB family nuclease